MKVLMLSTSYPRRTGDYAGNFVHNLCRGLTEAGIEVQVISPREKNEPKEDVIDGINIKRFDYFPLQSLAYGSGMAEKITGLTGLIQLPFFLLSFTINALRHAQSHDIIHCQWALSCIPGLIAARIFGKPVVATFHGAEIYSGKFKGIVKYVGEKTDALIFNSTYTQSRALKSMTPRKHIVIPPTTITTNKRERPARVDVTKELGIPPEKKAVFAVGRLVKRKGFNYLIDAAPMIDDKAFIIIGGGGEEKDNLMSQVKEKQLRDKIRFTGRLPDEDMEKYYNSCDVFVLPAIVDSRGDTEGLGLVLVEAGYRGKPVVASSVGGIPDIVEDGENGFLVKEKNPGELAEKINLLLKDRKLNKKMGESGARIAEKKFSQKATTEKTIHAYNQLLGVQESG